MLKSFLWPSHLLRANAFQRLVLLVGFFFFWPSSLLGCELAIGEIFAGASSRSSDIRRGWVEIKNLSQLPCRLAALGFSRFDGAQKTMGLRLNYQKSGLVIPGEGSVLFVNDAQVGLRQCGDVPVYHLPSPGIRMLKNRLQSLCLHTEDKLFECIDPSMHLAKNRPCLKQIVKAKVPTETPKESFNLSSNIWPRPNFQVASVKNLDGKIEIDVARRTGMVSWELQLKYPIGGNSAFLQNAGAHPKISFDSTGISPDTYLATLCATNPTGEGHCADIGEIKIVKPKPGRIQLSIQKISDKIGYREILVAYEMVGLGFGNIRWHGIIVGEQKKPLRVTGNNERAGMVRLFLPVDVQVKAIEAQLFTQGKMALGRVDIEE